jgi:hypothetical protein
MGFFIPLPQDFPFYYHRTFLATTTELSLPLPQDFLSTANGSHCLYHRIFFLLPPDFPSRCQRISFLLPQNFSYCT